MGAGGLFKYFEYAYTLLKVATDEELIEKSKKTSTIDEKTVDVPVVSGSHGLSNIEADAAYRKNLSDIQSKKRSKAARIPKKPVMNNHEEDIATGTAPAPECSATESRNESESSGLFHLLFLFLGLSVLPVIVAYWQKSMVAKPSGCPRMGRIC